MRKLNLSELLSFAGRYKFFTYASCVLSGASSLIAIIPFWLVWKIFCAVLFRENLENISRYGKFAVLFAAIAILIYVSALICSHLAAFKISSNIREKLLRHVNSPENSTQRAISEAGTAAESYLAHNLPDKYGAIFLALGLAAILFRVNWFLALVSIAPVILGFIVMAMMTGENVRKKIAVYQNALRLMSNEAVEYIKGIPTAKNSKRGALSFKKFQSAVQNYENATIAYTSELRLPMMLFTFTVNGSLLFLICAGVFMGVHYGFSKEFIEDFVFAVLVAPLISVTLMRIVRQNENAAQAAEALSRINAILAKPLEKGAE